VVSNLIKAPLVPRRLVVDQDIFQVLVEANMPAVLLELAFVTNPVEYKYLSSENGQNEIAGRLFNAFSSYKTKFDASVSVGKSGPEPVKTVEDKEVNARNSDASDTVNEYYSVQIMGLGRYLKDGDPALKGLDVNRIRKDDSKIYKYVTGTYRTVNEAKEALLQVRKKFPDAFVVKVTGNDVIRAN